jgi:hypothetical protein
MENGRSPLLPEDYRRAEHKEALATLHPGGSPMQKPILLNPQTHYTEREICLDECLGLLGND